VSPRLSCRCNATAIFAIQTNEFWVEAAKFLYVLGQSQGRTVASLRDAVKDALSDAKQGLQKLTPAEKEVWTEAVKAHANGICSAARRLNTPPPNVCQALALSAKPSSFAKGIRLHSRGNSLGATYSRRPRSVTSAGIKERLSISFIPDQFSVGFST
jgi:hypothetical protein